MKGPGTSRPRWCSVPAAVLVPLRAAPVTSTSRRGAPAIDMSSLSNGPGSGCIVVVVAYAWSRAQRSRVPHRRPRKAGMTTPHTVPLLPAGTRLIHIGHPKSGSTALQVAFARERTGLAEHGVVYPGRGHRAAEAGWAM